MTDEELARLSYEEMRDALRKAISGGDHALRLAIHAEREERSNAARYGKPGVSPLLSRRVVKATASLCKSTWPPEAIAENPDMFLNGFEDGVAAFASALLALPPDAPSPMEDES